MERGISVKSERPSSLAKSKKTMSKEQPRPSLLRKNQLELEHAMPPSVDPSQITFVP